LPPEESADLETRNVTDAWLRAVKPPASGRIEVRDSRVHGLIVRITSTGAISYSARRCIAGRHSRITVGKWPMGIAEARRLAMGTIIDMQKGADPVAEARAAQAPPVVLPTVAQRLDAWQAARGGAWALRHAHEVARVARVDIIPKLGARALIETTRADWVALVAAKQTTAPAMASLLYRTISAFLNFAEASGWIEHAPLPRRGGVLLAPGPRARERVLTDAELVRVWHGADSLSARGRALVRLLILSGARLNEVAGMREAEIDRAEGVWRLPGARAKNGQGYAIPLSSLALAEIDRCHCQPRTGALSKLKRQLDEAGGVSDWRLHDLRRTVRTGLSKLGVRREIAEAAINHVGGRSGLVGTYDRHDYAVEAADALRQWQVHVEGLVA
jgi:integrase